ncbi:MAG: CopD family protein [Pseudolabrys sp.]
MLETTLALTLHILGAVVWVGGMFATYVCLRPAAGSLEPPQRLALWRRFFAKFFPWVWVSVLLLLASGYWMVATTFGGFAGMPLYIHIMQGIGWLMILLFVYLFHGPWLKFKRAVDAQDWAAAGPQLNRIRDIIRINLPLGLIVVAVGGTGRFWGF